MNLTLKELTSKILIKDYISKETAFSLSKKIIELEPNINNMVKTLDTNSIFDLVNESNVLTKFHNYYNLIDFNFDEVDLIVEKIKKLVYNLTNENNFYLKMWANIYRKGDFIGYHSHGGTEPLNNKTINTHLSGHCFLYNTEPSYTTYYFYKDKKLLGGESGTEVLNVSGEISIFSSWLGHEFKKWDGDLRIGLAFDIITDTNKSIDDYSYKTPLRLIN
jgi:hypothetical protein